MFPDKARHEDPYQGLTGNPALSDVVEGNIRTLLQLRGERLRDRSIQDKLAYGLLTMLVSLEAIFLSTFVLISQNRLSEEAERRADLDLHIGMLDEAKMTFALKMLDQIQKKLDIDNSDDPALMDLLLATSPKDLLEEIARLQKHSTK